MINLKLINLKKEDKSDIRNKTYKYFKSSCFKNLINNLIVSVTVESVYYGENEIIQIIKMDQEEDVKVFGKYVYLFWY